jgi:hypothetical protein
MQINTAVLQVRFTTKDNDLPTGAQFIWIGGRILGTNEDDGNLAKNHDVQLARILYSRPWNLKNHVLEWVQGNKV